MSGFVDKELLRKLSKIAKIELKENEVQGLEKDIKEILGWAEQLKELEKKELKGKKELEKAPEVNFREDKVEISESERIISNFPKREGKRLKVPRSL